MSSEAAWETLKVDGDYEICKEYPYQIRRKDNGYIIAEWENKKSKYIQIKLNGQLYYKHIVIATQWIENDDPDNKVEVDHRNRIRTDYHVENLCWKTRSMNAFNRTGRGNITYEYVDDLPVDVVPIILYNGFEFEGYFIDTDGDVWLDNGEQYRKLYVQNNGTMSMYDIYHKRHRIGINGLRREFI